MKRTVYCFAVVALALNLYIGARIYVANAGAAAKDDAYAQIELFSRVLERVRKDYVDGDKISYQDLIYSALTGMLSKLDPHSEFLDPSKYQDLKQDTEGAFGGVGIVVGIKDGYLTVIAPMDESPAIRAGVIPGDRIVKIEGRTTGQATAKVTIAEVMSDAVKKLRGEPGSKVNVTIFRPSTSQTRDVELTRDVIKVKTVKDINDHSEFPLSDDKIGYARISQFNDPTGAELEDALKKMEKQGVQGVVLDLRGNPGGLLDQAVRVCEKFLPRNQLIVSTEGRSSAMRSEFRSSSREPRLNLPIVLLVNGSSASASEIVAGCLQDLKRAVLIGEQTFGKGSVQSIFPLQNGAGPALRLTTAKYYTPSHKVIHEKGITPDIIIPMSAEEEEALFTQRVPGGLDRLSEAERARVKSVRDMQLDRAMDLLRGLNLFSHRGNATANTVQ